MDGREFKEKNWYNFFVGLPKPPLSPPSSHKGKANQTSEVTVPIYIENFIKCLVLLQCIDIKI